jgi:hypothetical protein
VGETRDAYKLAYDEAVRALSQQQSVLDNFRTRGGILLSAAAIATSFLGGQALRQGSMSAWSWLAVLGFVGLSTSTLLILWPRKEWGFTAIPRRLISIYIETEEPLSVERIHRDLALHMQDSYDRNESGLWWLIVYFRVAVILLSAEVLAWVIDIASRS